MNLWVVTDDTDDGEIPISVAYWSWGSDEAIAAFHRECDGNERGYRPRHSVRRLDTEVAPPSESGCETRDAVLRLCGWRYECDRQCESCELYEMGGVTKVCDCCERCAECGCECEGDDQ